ncbi:SAV_2336 N-terminal domain-related protein [Streptomyces sp. NPDC020731]|uniref:SAV_2336 N-terminal domain-related protein n=1 Tax=Streptomyces sp. NPDC020731 TaxID=3365085 RepID=UPI0037A23F09
MERFGSLLADLCPAKQPPTPREVAELIWLARHLPEGVGQDGRVPPPSGEHLIPSTTEDGPGPDPLQAGDRDPSESRATRLYLPGDGSPDEGAETEAVQAAPVRVGGSAALPRHRELARALRPLKRRVPSTVSTVLDEEATVTRIAEHHHWIPVLTPAEDRWLDLVIVLDAYSASGVFWEPLARELRSLCRRLGAFRDVRLCRLLARSDGSPGLGISAATPPHLLRSTSSAVDSTGRTITLVLTDGVAPAWGSDMLRGALRKWAASGPTAILQTLPEHAWERTALAPEPGRFRSTEAGGANSTLLYAGYGLRSDGPKLGAVPVPVLGVSPEWLAPWAHAIAEPAAFDAAAVLLPASAALSRSGPGALDVNEVSGRDVTFDDFRAQAQPDVFRLAAYLAAVPLNLAVMRAVQSAMLPDSPLSDLAEIVYSGLLRTVHGGARTDEVLGQAYEFVPGARERLLSTIRRDEADEVIATISAYLKRNAPAISARFTAAVPDLEGTLTLPAGARHWAEVHNLVRRRQGGRPAPVVPREPVMPDVVTEPAPRPAEPTARSTVLVLTALPLEYAAVRAHVMERRELVHPDGTRAEEGRLPGTAWQVVLAELGMGAERTAALTTRLINWLRPEAVFFVGIAGSLKDDVGIGDVVVGTRVYEIHGGKQMPEGFLVRPTALPGSHALEQAARSAVRDMPGVRAHFMPIATGDIVLADAESEIARFIRRSYSDAGAIEMEGSGALQAARLSGRLDALVIRGISDRADGGKRDAYVAGSQERAAEQAVAVTMAVLRKHRPRHGNEEVSHRLGDGTRNGQGMTALLAALAEGAGGDGGRRAVEKLARAVGLEAGASVREIAEAAQDPARREAVREWGEAVADLLAADPRGVAGAVARAMERSVPGSGTSWYDGDHVDFRGGVFLREVVGVQVVIQQGGAADPEAMAGLPPRPGGFTGREEETAVLLGALDPAGAQSSGSAATLVAAVSGLGGIGKTALAVETAHLARERGWFPGGVLFIDLHGYDREPVTADRALQALLRALGTPPEHIPTTTDERAALYRSTLAARAQERGAVLVLADNASSSEQVRLLLPGGSRHHVLVTSRHRLPQLGARFISLDRLSPRQSYELLDRALRIADPHDSRVADDPDMAERLAGLCGHLPLALQIAAALLAEDPGKPVTELVAELAESHDRLDHLDGGERSVRAAFELSYRRLPPEPARLLRLLALAPGPEVSDEVVAALVGAAEPPMRDLRELARAHLVEREGERGWWRLHDLVRVFGADVVAGDAGLREEGEAARERVLGFYVRWADAADDRLRWLPGMAEPERFGDRGQALAWLDGERAGLVAAVGWGREERFAGAALRLALCLGEYLAWRRYFDDWIAVAEAARKAAQRVGDRLGEAMAWNNLGSALGEAGRAGEAIDAHTRARDLYQTVGDRDREAMAWNSLGVVLGEAGRAGEAIDAHTRARDLYRAVGDRHGEGRAWNNLGMALREAGRAGEAIDAHTRARDLYRAVGDRHGEGRAWNNLGMALREAGRVDEETEAYGRSLELFRGFEDRYGEGRTLHNLARAHEAARRPAEARAAYLQAADAFTRANAPDEAAQVRTRAAVLDDSPTR